MPAHAQSFQLACRLRHAVIIAIVSAHLAVVSALVSRPAYITSDEGCDRELLLMVHRRLEPSVRRISEIHFNFTSARHYEVTEIISTFHADRLCKSALNVVESFRLSLSLLVCPSRFAPMDSTSTVEFPGSFRLTEHAKAFFRDLVYVTTSGDESLEANVIWDGAGGELTAIADKVTNVIMQSLGAGRSMYVNMFAALDPLVERVVTMVQDFLFSLAGDMSSLFLAPNHVANEMIPRESWKAKTAPDQPSAPTDIFMETPHGRMLNPPFLELLGTSPGPIRQPGFFYTHQECQSSILMDRLHKVPLEFQDTPFAHSDVSGIHWRQPSPLQLLQNIARHTRLSNLFVSLQLSSFLLSPEPTCGSQFSLFDPTVCLADQNWGGYNFNMNPLPPYNLTITYMGKAIGPGVRMPAQDVHSIHVETRETQWSSLVSLFKSVNHHSPDLFFLSPMIGNCLLVDRLLRSGTIKPKLLYLPINPVVPPPLEDIPDYFQWWTENTEDFLKQLFVTHVVNEEGEAKVPITTGVALAQCALASSAKILGRLGYALLHVEHTYAVFVWGPLEKSATGSTSIDSASDFRAGPAGSSHGSASAGLWVEGSSQHDQNLRLAWLRGWKCSPLSPYLLDLDPLQDLFIDSMALPVENHMIAISDTEVSDSPHGPIDRTSARKFAAHINHATPISQYFIESGDRQQRRGRCAEGECNCFPPYRGPLCLSEDLPLKPQSLRAVIHYITADNERDLQDIKRSLVSLWSSFNQHYDHPIVIFHDGLSVETRKQIIYASENRVWLVYLPDFRTIPHEWRKVASESARDFSVGYRAMIRWRSGPVFLEPALAGFDYAMTLDTDSYFPNDVGMDPFKFVHDEGLVAAFPHLGRESASVIEGLEAPPNRDACCTDREELQVVSTMHDVGYRDFEIGLVPGSKLPRLLSLHGCHWWLLDSQMG